MVANWESIFNIDILTPRDWLLSKQQYISQFFRIIDNQNVLGEIANQRVNVGFR